LNSLAPLGTRTGTQSIQRITEVYKENALPFVGLTALIEIPNAILTFVLSQPLLQLMRNPDYQALVTSKAPDVTTAQTMVAPIVTPTLLWFGVAIIALVLKFVVIDSLITLIAADAELGRKTTVSEAFAKLRPAFRHIFSGAVSYVLLMLGIGLICIISFVLTSFISIVLFWSFWVGLLATLYILTWPLLLPTLIFEPIPAGRGAVRAFRLTKARVWPIVGLTLGIALTLNVLIPALGGLFGDSTLGMIAGTVLVAFFAIFAGPILVVGNALFYLEARVRTQPKETLLDLTPASTIIAQQTPPTPLVNNEDWVNLGIVFMIMFILVLLVSVALGVFAGT
jgi:hypothetical protein